MYYAGKLVVITGAAGGIGRPTAKSFLERGADLLLIDVNADALAGLAAELGAPSKVRTAVSTLDSPAACAKVLEGAGKAVHAIVHLAGIFVPHELTAESRGVWDRTLGANLDNAYDLTVAALPHFDAGSVARIVYITSVAFRRGSPDHAAYSAAKGGLVGLTRALARKLAPRVLVNAIAPGIIETGMPAHIIRDRGDRLLNEIPLQRWGTPQEVANVIEFLCGPGSTYITGQVINVDGGISNA